MKLNVFLIVAAIVVAVFGVGLLLFPNEVAAIYGTSLSPGGVVSARYAGSSLIALAIVLWSSRDQNGTEMFRGVLLSGVVGNACNLVIAYLAVSGGVWSSGVGWASVLLHVLFLVGFAYFLFGRR